MPISIKELDSSIKEENITLILGKNILLKIVEELEKQTLLKDNTVKKLISIPNLCHDDLRSLIEEVIKKESLLIAPGSVKYLLEVAESKDVDVLFKIGDAFEKSIMSAKFYKNFEKVISQTAQREFGKMPRKDLESIGSDFMFRFMGRIDEKLVQSENKKLMAISEKIKEKAGFDILVPSNLLLCPTCRTLLSTEEYRGSKKCYACKKEIKREDADRVYTYKVPDPIKKVWEENLWFEAFVARLLRRLGCKTWTSVHVMGASGILHEVDVLAIRKGTVLIAECKTGKVSRNDVFNFCTKVGDLKAHFSILAFIKELPEPETREFVKKNPAIIGLENMGKMSETDILDELERRLPMKS